MALERLRQIAQTEARPPVFCCEVWAWFWDAAVWVVRHDEAALRAVNPGQRSAGMHDDALLVELHRGRN